VACAALAGVDDIQYSGSGAGAEDAAGEAAQGQDAADASSSPCADAAGVLLCLDFDEPDWLSRKQNLTMNGPTDASVSVDDAEAVSPTNSIRFVLDPIADAATSWEISAVGDDFSMPQRPTRFTLSFDLLVEQTSSYWAEWAEIAVIASQPDQNYELELVLQNGQLWLSEYDSVTQVSHDLRASTVYVPGGAWFPVQLTFTIPGGASTATASLMANGNSSNVTLGAGTVGASFLGSPRFYFGLGAPSVSAAWIVRFDNVLFDAK
jgi:hypothetical protein